MSCFGLGKSKAWKNVKQQGVPNKQAATADSSDEEVFAEQPTDLGRKQELQKLFTKDAKIEDKLVGVVVTIFEGSSYDENFRVMQPRTVPGERVSTYSMQCRAVLKLHELLTAAGPAPQAQSVWADLLEDLRGVPADSVTLNWECCGGCGDHGFPLCGASAGAGRRRSPAGRQQQGTSLMRASGAASPTMQLMGLAVRRGFTVMCSDFSLKALLAEWSEEHLGPNPFVKLAEECDEQFQLEFLPLELQSEEVPQQLQVVGELCAEQGMAIVQALGGTILYTVSPTRAPTELYELKVLTVVGDWGGRALGGDMPEALKCAVGSGSAERRGAAGHVTLTYASGGQLLTSMGHWIELTRIDTSLESVMQVAARNFGQADLRMLNAEYESLGTATERQECVQKWSKNMVQQSVPTRMKCRTKY